MLGLHVHDGALAVELGHERIGDLRGQLLLQLQTTGKDLDRAGKLGKSRDATVGNVADGCLAVERQHMVFAQRVEGDVALDDEVVAGDGEGLGQMLGSASVHAVAKLEIHARNAVGRLDKPLARGVLADTLKQQANRLAHLILIDHLYQLSSHHRVPRDSICKIWYHASITALNPSRAWRKRAHPPIGARRPQGQSPPQRPRASRACR